VILNETKSFSVDLGGSSNYSSEN